MHTGIGEKMWRFLAAFYTDDSMVQYRCPVQLQSSLVILVALFKHVGLWTNVTKTKMMICILGRIQMCQTREVYNDHIEGHANTGQWRPHCVECYICDKNLTATSLRSNLETQHGIFRSFVLNR